MKYAIESGIIDLSYIQGKYEMNKREELLNKHPYKIWESKDGKHFYTYLPDEKKGRVLKKRTTRKGIEDVIIEYIEKNTPEGKKKESITLKELFKDWIEYKEKHTNSTSYIKRITADWTRYYQPQKDFINKPIQKFEKVELDAWAHDMIKNFSLTKKQYYNMTVILRQSLDYAKEKGYIEQNVFSEVKINSKMFCRVKKKEANTQVYMTDEIPKMVKDMVRRFKQDPSNTAPLAVLLDFETGIRVGELVALKTTDITPDGNYIHIQRQVVRDFEKVDNNGYRMKFAGFKVVEYTKSEDSDRYVYLTDLAKKIIMLAIETNRVYNHKCDDYLFVYGNQRINHYAIQARILRGCQSIGIITKSVHKIRKTYISSLIDSGLNIDEIRRQAGHSDERTTYGNYCYNRLTNNETNVIIENALKYDADNMGFVEDCQEVIKGNQILLQKHA